MKSKQRTKNGKNRRDDADASPMRSVSSEALRGVCAVLFAILIFRSFEKHVGWIHMLSMIVFLMSGLGLINLAFKGHGGILGKAISSPIVSAVDVTATVIFLFAFMIASLVVAFDVHLGVVVAWIKARFSRTEQREGEEDE